MAATLASLWERKRKQPAAPSTPVDLTAPEQDVVKSQPVDKVFTSERDSGSQPSILADSACAHDDAHPAAGHDRKRQRTAEGPTDSSNCQNNQQQMGTAASSQRASGTSAAECDTSKRKAKLQKAAAHPKTVLETASVQGTEAGLPDSHASGKWQAENDAETKNKQQDSPNIPAQSAEGAAAAGGSRLQQEVPNSQQLQQQQQQGNFRDDSSCCSSTSLSCRAVSSSPRLYSQWARCHSLQVPR